MLCCAPGGQAPPPHPPVLMHGAAAHSCTHSRMCGRHLRQHKQISWIRQGNSLSASKPAERNCARMLWAYDGWCVPHLVRVVARVYVRTLPTRKRTSTAACLRATGCYAGNACPVDAGSCCAPCCAAHNQPAETIQPTTKEKESPDEASAHTQ